MKQYNGIKVKYPDALLLFRVGDFYETFGEDAIRASKILGIVLTKRKNGAAAFIELAGFPHHSLDTYLPKLVRAGNRVAICDQLEDPKQTKTIVKRGVTELVTPGVSFNDQVLDTKTNNFLAAIFLTKDQAGIAFLDISTGEFILSQGNLETVDKLVQGLNPSEVLMQRQQRTSFTESFGDRFYTFQLEDWAFNHDFAVEKLQGHFGTNSLKGFGIEDQQLGVVAAGAILHYLEETKHLETQHIQSISRLEEDKYVWLDKFTIRNLELISSPHQDAITLIDILDHTVSPMGGRMLKRWVVLPLKESAAIENRLNAVEYLTENIAKAEELSKELKQIGDLERLISKAAARRIGPRELVQLGRALSAIIPIKESLASSESRVLQQLGSQLNLCEVMRNRIQK
ncbi:MAG: DNA mismatch repair protein MutS, partial [Flavobacteriales bacterium]